MNKKFNAMDFIKRNPILIGAILLILLLRKWIAKLFNAPKEIFQDLGNYFGKSEVDKENERRQLEVKETSLKQQRSDYPPTTTDIAKANQLKDILESWTASDKKVISWFANIDNQGEINRISSAFGIQRIKYAWFLDAHNATLKEAVLRFVNPKTLDTIQYTNSKKWNLSEKLNWIKN